MDFKNVLIFGDSYSTFAGYIPNGFAVYYSDNGSGETDVSKVSETWWYQLLKESNSELIQNNSWSGSTVCYTGYDGDCSETSSFICRLNKLACAGFFEKNEINTVFVFGGTNDSWANSPIGKLKYSDWEKEDLFSVLPAFCFFINKLKDILPRADIVCIINTELKPEITDGFKSACKHFGIKQVVLNDIDKLGGHPTVKGMTQIKNQILNSLS